MNFSSGVPYALFLIILFFRLNHDFTVPQTVFLSVVTVLIMRLADRGSFIIQYEDRSILLNHQRSILECLALCIDEYWNFNYGLQFLLFGRFIDIFLFGVTLWPYIQSLTPHIKPMINEYFAKPEPRQRKPLFSD